MTGMLPGVECARRRRFHRSGGCSDLSSSPALGSSRRSSFCLYVSSNESVLSSSFSLRSSVEENQANTDGCEDGKLGAAAREAKERLDERLRAARKLVTKRRDSESEEIRTRMARMSWKWWCWDQPRERIRG